MSKDKTVENAVLMGMLLGPVTIGALFLTATLKGWALSLLWKWFIAGSFNLPEIGIANAIGISTLISLLTYQHIDCQPSDKDSTEKMFTNIFISVFSPLCALGFGYIVTLFM